VIFEHHLERRPLVRPDDVLVGYVLLSVLGVIEEREQDFEALGGQLLAIVAGVPESGSLGPKICLVVTAQGFFLEADLGVADSGSVLIDGHGARVQAQTTRTWNVHEDQDAAILRGGEINADEGVAGVDWVSLGEVLGDVLRIRRLGRSLSRLNVTRDEVEEQ